MQPGSNGFLHGLLQQYLLVYAALMIALAATIPERSQAGL